MRFLLCGYKQFIYIIILYVTTAGSLRSQSYFYNDKYYENDVLFEFGAGVGSMNCLTDLGGKKGKGKRLFKDANWKNTQLCTNLYFGVNFKEVFSLRLEATFGKVKAYDSILSKYKSDAQTQGRYYRNLNFRSHVTEFALMAEFHPLMLRDDVDREVPIISPYIIAGIGTFSFAPKTYFEGRWIDVAPLRLEGQGFKEYADREIYKTRAVSFPMGLGLKYEMGPLFVARFEVIHRFTNTDYLDDVSQGTYIDPSLFATYLTSANALLATKLYDRHKELDANYILKTGEIRGNAKDNDAYFTINIKIGLILGRSLR